MSRIYRYKFTKDIYPEYIVLLLVKGNYVTYGNDYELLRYIKFKNKLSVFDKYKINYLVLDDLDIEIIKEYDVNNYTKYLHQIKLESIIVSIGNNLVRNI